MSVSKTASVARNTARKAKSARAAKIAAPTVKFVDVKVSLDKPHRAFARAFYKRVGDTSHEHNARWLTMRADCYDAMTKRFASYFAK